MQTNPIANLKTTEHQLATIIHATAEAIDRIGTQNIDDALSRLHASAEACKGRIHTAQQDLFATVADVLSAMGLSTMEIAAGLVANAIPAELDHAPQPTATPSELSESLAQIDEGDDEVLTIGKADQDIIPALATAIGATAETNPEEEPAIVTMAANAPVVPTDAPRDEKEESAEAKGEGKPRPVQKPRARSKTGKGKRR